MIPFTAASGILTYAWPFAQTKESLIAVTVIYGYGYDDPYWQQMLTMILLDSAQEHTSHSSQIQ